MVIFRKGELKGRLCTCPLGTLSTHPCAHIIRVFTDMGLRMITDDKARNPVDKVTFQKSYSECEFDLLKTRYLERSAMNKQKVPYDPEVGIYYLVRRRKQRGQKPICKSQACGNKLPSDGLAIKVTGKVDVHKHGFSKSQTAFFCTKSSCLTTAPKTYFTSDKFVGHVFIEDDYSKLKITKEELEFIAQEGICIINYNPLAHH